MKFLLETQRLILRSFEEGDAERFAEYRSDPAVARYQGWDAPFSLTQAKQFLDVLSQTKPGTPGEWFQIALQLGASGELIGDCAFCVLDNEPRQAEIGFTLAQPYQHCGYAVEAVTRMMDYLFNDLHLHRVRAICDVENLASVRVLERLGLRQEGRLLDNVWFKGRWSSEYVYAILESEWRAQRAGDTP